MRALRFVVPASSVITLAVLACGGSSHIASFDDDAGSAGPGAEGGAGSSGGFGGMTDGGGTTGPDTGSTTTTTIFANTDTALYSLDPATKAVKLIGTFAGTGADGNVTDCAVDAAGDVYVNTVSVVYRAALPAGGSGTVQLTKVATIGAKSGQRFYALAFAPAGVLGATETLVGGDGNGELWSIDPTTGATKDLGGFGPDKTGVFALSGDLVFYTDPAGKPTGLATIRSCKSGGSSCTATDDYLAGIDMAALSAAFTSGTPAASLLSGIYGGSTASKGSGIGHGDLFGLGAWEGSVYGFERSGANGGKPALLTIDTTTGAGTILPGSFSFTDGWSGACVTTKVTINVPPPPAGPK